MTVNLTATSPVNAIQIVNNLSHGLLGVSIILALWLLVYFRNKDEGNKDAMVGATFVSSIAAIFLGIMGILNDQVFGIAIIAFIGSIVMLFEKQR